uniref:Angiopoietin-like 4 n=1 Tax=Gasterosteus aculeatus aculeatus TaxID=481459 RepID=A0AAQ4P1B0_GASAC
MKTTLATLTLCLVVLMAIAFPLEKKGGSSSSSGAKEKRVPYAAWDDVNVIAHGLLQLGQGLKEHVDKTKVQMRDIATKLKVFNRTVTDLGKESQKLRGEGEALKARAHGLEDREGHLLNVTAELREKAEEMQHERRTMSERMSRLEERVDIMLQGDSAVPDTNPGAKNNSDAHNIQVQQSRQRASSRSSNSDAQSGVAEQRDSPAEMASDCHELFLRGESTSGVYTIQPINAEAFKVFCEMTADGGWTVIQNRQDGSVDFDQLWTAYKTGFGSLNGEFWLGLEKIHSIAKDGGHILDIVLADWSGDMASVRLPFHLGGEETKYSLKIQKADAFSPLESSLASDATAGLTFSTRDQDNDQKNDTNCAKHLSGGWWFSNCGRSNLNGRYFQSPPPKQRDQRKQSIFWKTWRGRYYPLKSSRMMIAPAVVENKS